MFCFDTCSRRRTGPTVLFVQILQFLFHQFQESKVQKRIICWTKKLNNLIMHDTDFKSTWNIQIGKTNPFQLCISVRHFVKEKNILSIHWNDKNYEKLQSYVCNCSDIRHNENTYRPQKPYRISNEKKSFSDLKKASLK